MTMTQHDAPQQPMTCTYPALAKPCMAESRVMIGIFLTRAVASM